MLPGTLPEAPFSAKGQFLVDFWDLARSQNWIRDAPGTLQNCHGSSLRLEKRPDRLLGGPRKGPRHPQGYPRDLPETVLRRFLIDF